MDSAPLATVVERACGHSEAECSAAHSAGALGFRNQARTPAGAGHKALGPPGAAPRTGDTRLRTGARPVSEAGIRTRWTSVWASNRAGSHRYLAQRGTGERCRAQGHKVGPASRDRAPSNCAHSNCAHSSSVHRRPVHSRRQLRRFLCVQITSNSVDRFAPDRFAPNWACRASRILKRSRGRS